MLLQSFLVDPGRRSHDLDVLALDVLGRTLPGRDTVLGKGKTARPRETVDARAVLAQLTEELALVIELRERLSPRASKPSGSPVFTNPRSSCPWWRYWSTWSGPGS